MVRRKKTTSQADLCVAGFDPYLFAGDCVYDHDAARKACAFFESELRHVKGIDKPFILEPWQRAIVSNLFGWKRPDGTRRFRECFVFVPRKNGKTTLLAGIVLYMLLCDGERGAEIYSAAADQDQAALLYQQASGMVLCNPELSSRCEVHKGYKTITRGTSFYKAISSEAATKHGYNAHCAVVDELHAQPNRDLVDVLQSSMGNRPQPLMLHITTAGFDKQSICYEKYEYAGKVRDGIVPDESFLPVIYEADKDDDWKIEATWERANPNLGVSIRRDFLQAECRKAQDIPAYENTFRRLYLNQWTEQDVRWLSLDKWDACQQEIDDSDLQYDQCYAGLDLSSKVDVTALVLVFTRRDGSFALKPYFWIPEEAAHEREKKDRVPYTTWARQGHLTMTPGNVVDYDYIRSSLGELRDRFQIAEIAFDPWNATQMATQLGQDGFEMVEFRQGLASMTNPSKEFEKLIVGRKLIHDGNPVLRWMVSNVAAEQDAAGNIKPSKKRSREKIDGVVASIMGLGRALLSEGTGPLMVF